MSNPNRSISKDAVMRRNNGRDKRVKRMGGSNAQTLAITPGSKTEILQTIAFLEDFGSELEDVVDVYAPNPYYRMSLHLIRSHLEAKTVTPTSLIGEAGVPYATGTRRMKEMVDSGLIELRPRTRTGKTFSVHPSDKLLDSWLQLATRIKRLAEHKFELVEDTSEKNDYYYGSSYLSTKTIPPMQVLSEPLKLAGGIRVLVHGDPTFMVMDNLKRQFENVIGTQIQQRAFSIDRLHEELIKNSERKTSRYDIVAVDLPWIGELVEKGVLMPLEDALDIKRLDPADFHTAGWKAAHWGRRAYGVPAQTTPELLFYRKDMFAEAGIEAPATTDQLLAAAKALHDPVHGRYGIAWNAARGTALGHTFLMTLADFGAAILDLNRNAGGFDTDALHKGGYRVQIDTEKGLAAAEYLLALMNYSPPSILSMSWYERVRPYAAGNIAMAYGYTLLAPYFELDPSSPAAQQTGYLPHPAGPNASAIAPVGGYVMCIPSNIAPERLTSAAEALIAFTSPEAQKLYVQNGSRTNPRYSVGSDPEVRSASTIFEAVDAMSWRDELQFWPRPPVPEINDIIRICGEELHDMLRGIVSPRDALARAQLRADAFLKKSNST